MAYRSWAEPVRLLRESIGEPGTRLRAVGSALEVPFESNRLLYSAMLEDALSILTGNREPRPATERQLRFLSELGVESGDRITVRVADALIKTRIALERIEALEALRPARGDRLVRSDRDLRGRVGEIVEVTSVDRLGSVWIVGAGGYPTHPQDLRRP